MGTARQARTSLPCQRSSKTCPVVLPDLPDLVGPKPVDFVQC
jgi:hypothetical protein